MKFAPFKIGCEFLGEPEKFIMPDFKRDCAR